MIDFVDKTTTQGGTPINRINMMAIQGFQAQTTVFNDDESIVETNGAGQTRTTTFSTNANGEDVITEVFRGEKTITKTTTFKRNGNIEEVIL